MDIYEVLKNDHDEVRNLLEELVALNDNDDYRHVLIEQIANEIIPHSRAEESVFYNTMRAVSADKKVVFHGYGEHMKAETLLRTLQAMDKLDMSWKGVAVKLKEALDHHIAEEESDIFSEARTVFSQEEALAMGEAFQELKPKVKEQSMIGTTADMVINMMPPRLADKIRDFGINARES